jgi:hypothetical protein
MTHEEWIREVKRLIALYESGDASARDVVGTAVEFCSRVCFVAAMHAERDVAADDAPVKGR